MYSAKKRLFIRAKEGGRALRVALHLRPNHHHHAKEAAMRVEWL
jgi:hypothetical protein